MLVFMCAFLMACQGTPGPPETDPRPFTGPDISIDSSGLEHVLVALLPNPGYRFTLDWTGESFNRRDLFVTFRRPNPAVMYPQVIVEQRLATGVKSQVPIAAYARLIDFDDRSGRVTHSKAAQTPSSSAPGP